MTEAERYLAKAGESLASAEADVAAGRYNSAANRAYYAAFQAVVAALIHAAIRPKTGNWQHRFVLSQFSGRLVTKRKLLAHDLPALIDELFSLRVTGDYQPLDVPKRDARDAIKAAARVLSEVSRMTQLHSVREASGTYQEEHRKAQARLDEAEQYVTGLQDRILKVVPGAQFDVIRLGPTDYRLNAYVDTEKETRMARKAIAGYSIDILVDHDIWIVVLPQIKEAD